jgi:hypothetical protein
MLMSLVSDKENWHRLLWEGVTKEDFNEIVENMLSMSLEGTKYHIYDLSKYRTVKRGNKRRSYKVLKEV